jgi:hypothetical protein
MFQQFIRNTVILAEDFRLQSILTSACPSPTIDYSHPFPSSLRLSGSIFTFFHHFPHYSDMPRLTPASTDRVAHNPTSI